LLIGIVGVLLMAGAAIGFATQGGGGGGGGAGEGAGDGTPVTQVDADLGAREEPSSREFSAATTDEDGALLSKADDASGAAPLDQAPEADPKLQGLLDRKIIQSTSVDIGVEGVGASFQEIIRIATTAGGFVASSSFSNVDDLQVADLTIRVPGDAYQTVLGQIRGMGEVATETSDAQDATEEYTDLQARLRTLQATEQRYLELLARAETIPDILTVQDRLDGVRGQIEQVQGRINLLDHLTELATITVHLRPLAAAVDGGGGGPQPLEVAENAWQASLDALRGVAAVALAVVAFSWWLVPPLAGLGIGARWWLGRRPRPAAPTSV
jgi:hypothetical protein